VPHIRVVDDEPDVRELVETLLAGQGYEIHGVVVSDLRMPDVDGIAVYRAVQSQPTPRPAIVFMSGFTNATEFVPFLRETGAPVVAKPFDVHELRSVVRRLVEQR
jgi:two-component system C4-dicarboxylate transport response regulator DctD